MRVSNFIKIISTGFIVLLLMSLVLFWLRWTCDYSLYENMSNYADRKVSISPSKLVPSEVDNDPVVSNKSLVTATISFHTNTNA